MIRVAGAFALVAGLGFGIPGAIGTRYFSEHGRVWMFMGFPTYGGGPFASHGIPTSMLLLAGFQVVCAAELALGVLLVAGWRPALVLQFLLLPFELAYWWGFALPFGFAFGAVRVAAAIVALRGLP